MSPDAPVEAKSDIRQFFHLIPTKRLLDLKDEPGKDARGRRPRDGARMSKKPMNRWIIVAGAILIQLALGAIYAWSAFTTPLQAPIADTTFIDMASDEGVNATITGKLAVGTEKTLSLSFAEGGAPVSNFTSVTVVWELRDADNAAISAEKQIVKSNLTAVDDAYPVAVRVKKAGNWHATITAVRNESGTEAERTYDILLVTSPGEFAYTKTQTQGIFSAGLATFGIVMILAGRLQQKIPSRWIALAGGIVLGIGYVMAGLMGTAFIWKLIFIGIVGGAGIGLAYVVPIAVGVKWFPDKKGLLTGLAVAGFGFGAFIWILLANPPKLLGIDGLIQPELIDGIATYTASNVNMVFIIFGILFAIIVSVGALVMVPPPEGWLPEGYTPPAAKGKAGSSDFVWSEMLGTWQFYALWTMFMAGALAGLMVIGSVQDFAKDPLDGFTSYDFTPEQAADFAVIAAALCLPLLSGAGRILWGLVSDKIGRKTALIVLFAIQAVVVGAFFFTPFNEYAFYVVAATIGFNFGGTLALFPAATADYFGSKNVGLNYGIMFTAYAAGGIAGPLLAGLVKDEAMKYTYAFVPAAILCVVALVIALALRPPVKKEDEKTPSVQ